jgi:hypothetical protein
MSLEGNLTSFGLAEILQLIAGQQKTGLLSVTRQTSSMKLFFKEGRIVSTRDRRKGAVDPLKDYLARYGIISSREIVRLTELSTRAKLDITDVILSEGTLTEDELKRHCRNHIQETVYDILTWEQCSYKFIAGSQVMEGVRVLADLPVEGLLMESMRWIDEFPLMLEEFPTGETTVKRKEGAAAQEELTRNETAVLELLADERTVDDLIAHAKIPRFETIEALRQLKEKGLVEAEHRASPTAERDTAEPPGKPRATTQRPNLMPLVASAVVFVACVLWGARSVLPFHRLGRSAGDAAVAKVEVLSTDRDRIEENLRWCLEVYRAKYGSYPKDLSVLEDAKIAPPSLFERAREHSFRYHLTPGGYRYILL